MHKTDARRQSMAWVLAIVLLAGALVGLLLYKRGQNTRFDDGQLVFTASPEWRMETCKSIHCPEFP